MILLSSGDACGAGQARDRNRGQTVLGGAIAQLPLPVLSPALHSPTRQQCTRVPGPAVSAAAPEISETATGLSRLFLVVPSPTVPYQLSPQHFTVPPEVTAHAWSAPAAIDVTPGQPRDTGAVRLSVVPSPSRPSVFCPQHLTVPSESSAHVKLMPATRAVTPESPLDWTATQGAWSPWPREHDVQLHNELVQVAANQTIQVRCRAWTVLESMLQERAALEQEPWLVLLIHGQLERCCHHGRGYKPTEPTAVGADLSLGLSDPSVGAHAQSSAPSPWVATRQVPWRG